MLVLLIIQITLSETAANAAACTSCILCWKMTKAAQSDFCTQACHNLADARAPFLLEIPRGHVAFKQGSYLSPYLLHSKNDEYHVPHSCGILYIRMAEIKHPLSYCQKSLYGRNEAKFYDEL